MIPDRRVDVAPTSTTENPKFRIFKTENNVNQTAQCGSTAELECQVASDNASVNVTWRKVGVGVLTRNNKTLVDDKRFLAKTKYGNVSSKFIVSFVFISFLQYWVLRIRYTQKGDEGFYECRIDGDLEGSILVNLTLQRAWAVINDAGINNTKEVKAGAVLRLSCYIENNVQGEKPLYIFWYKDDRVINYDLTDGSSIREGSQGSELIFPSAKPSDAGNYSCVPSNADQASIFVSVKGQVDQPH
ncbi:junctional adhesion molecule B [Asbolus verrucosus]|uniref:Junctional adhesion molecule B n=1 Tax=Asbolus verrucosus TaxID=1661398 RepID=A0A482WDV1_ASBVE|nr:junctional adhesion molecule B [Asbolus verrucosus]